MNFAMVIGCVVGRYSVTTNSKDERFITFKLATMNDINGEAVYVNCKCRYNLAVKFLSLIKNGTPIAVRGFIDYGIKSGANYLFVTFIEFLLKSDKPENLSLKQFLEIYQPARAIQEYNEIVKKQEKEKKEDVSQCLDTS